MNKHSKKIAQIIFAILVLASVVWVISTNTEKTFGEHSVFLCSDEKKIDVSFYKKSIVVHFDKNNNVRFVKDLSNDIASRYRSLDQSMTLWINDRYIMIEEGNSVPYYDCSVSGPGADSFANPSVQIPSGQVQIAPKVE